MSSALENFFIPFIFNVLAGTIANLTYDKCKSLVGLLEKKDIDSIFNNAINKNFNPDRINEVDIHSIRISILKYNITDYSEFDTEAFKNKLSNDVYDNLVYKDDITFQEFDQWFKAYLDDLRYFLIEELAKKPKVKDIVELDALLKIIGAMETIESHLTYISELVRKNMVPVGVRIIDDELFRHSVSLEEIKQYYNGAYLTWDIVSSDGIIERDAYKTLIEEWIPPTDVTNMICIVSDAGEGKTSLAYKFIYDLFQKKENLIFQITHFENPDIWREFENIWKFYKRPFIVFVENVFRNENVVVALQNMDRYIPMTILATSRTNEYSEKRFPFRVRPISLERPSYEEKKRILGELENKGIKLGAIDDDLLEESVPFLVFMMEATHGKKFEKIIEDEIEVLKKIDKDVNQAYQYLCSTYQYDISIPKSILEKLDDDFYNIEAKEASRGIILIDDIRNENLRTRHPLIATYSAKYYNRDRVLINKIFNSINPKKSEESKFMLHLFRSMVRTDISNIDKILHHNENKIEEFYENATISDMALWIVIFKAINAYTKISKCIEIALNKKPESGWDCRWLIEFYKGKKEEFRALPRIQNYLMDNPKNNFVRTSYLGLVRNGTQKQKDKAIFETEIWLSENPYAINIWPGLLKLLISENNFDKAIELARIAEEFNPNNPIILSIYLQLLQEKLPQEEVIAKYKRLCDLAPDDDYRIVHYANWLRTHEFFTQAEQLYETIIDKNPNNYKAFYGYGRLLLKLEKFEDACRFFIRVINIRERHVMAYNRLALALIELGRFDEADKELDNAIFWGKLNKSKLGLVYHNKGLLYLKLNRFEDAKIAFDKCVQEEPDNFANYWHIGESYFFLKDYRNAEKHLLISLEKSPSNLGPPASEEIDKLLQECRKNLQENDKPDNDTEIDQLILNLNKKFNK